jgi:hypothetical protein
LQITDIAGKRIFMQEINPSFDDKIIVNLTGFSKGLYVLTVKYSSGSISTKKFLVN